MKLITINKPSQIKVGQRYRSRSLNYSGRGYSYFDFWIERKFYTKGYRLKTKFIYKGKAQIASRSSLSENLPFNDLSEAKRILFGAFCDPDFNTVWKVGK